MSSIFEKSSIFTLFIRFCLPNLISAAFLSAYFIIDGIFVGLFLGSQSLAAMGIVMPFIIMSFALSDMIAIGSSVQISMHLGSGKIQRARMIFSASVLIIFAISSTVALFAFFSHEYLLSLLNISKEMQELCKEYLLVFIYFAPIISLPFALDNYLRICAKTKYSMSVNIIIALSNILFAYLFIVEFEWGLFGAAFATCLGFILGAFLAFIPFLFQDLVLKFSTLYMNFKMFINILYNGSSEFFNTISFALFNVFANAVLLKLGSVDAVAVFSIILYIDGFIAALIFSLCDSMQAPLSYNYAAKNYERIKSILKLLLCVSFVFSGMVFITVLNYDDEILTIFVKNEEIEVLKLAKEALFVFSFIYIICWFNITSASFLTALNKPHSSLFIGLSRNFLAPIVFLYTLPLFLGLKGVFLAPFLANAVVMFLSIFFLLKTLKRYSII